VREAPGVVDRFEATHRKGDPTLYRFYDRSVEETFRAAFETGGPLDPLHAMLRFDRRHFLPALLNIDDKMCGRHSLEGRPSLLHQRLVRRVNTLDPRCLLDGGVLKPVLRRLAAGTVPEAVVNRTDKMGFTTPIGTFVNRSSAAIREQLEGSRFRDLYDLSRAPLTAEHKFSREVFGLLMLDLWLNRYAVAPPVDAEAPAVSARTAGSVLVPRSTTGRAPAQR
jgi:asparagine synthase (glutamine-hydrolysing)